MTTGQLNTKTEIESRLKIDSILEDRTAFMKINTDIMVMNAEAAKAEYYRMQGAESDV
jgi:hypothetical protein